MGVAVVVDDDSSTSSDDTAIPLLLPPTDDGGCHGGCDGDVVLFNLFADVGGLDNLSNFL